MQKLILFSWPSSFWLNSEVITPILNDKVPNKCQNKELGGLRTMIESERKGEGKVQSTLDFYKSQRLKKYGVK